MGREVRMVPKDWEHPKEWNGHHKPLRDGIDFEERVREWKEEYAKWYEGFRRHYGTGEWVPRDEDDTGEYWDYAGGPPYEEEYMLVGVPAEERTHYMMYEDVSEGTPISPAFETAEELARWLADTGASAFAGRGATYETWLRTIEMGSAMSGAWSSRTGLISGVEANLMIGDKPE